MSELIPDLSNEGLKAWRDNLDAICREYTKATGISEDVAEVSDLLKWIRENKEALRPHLHPNTAMLLKTDSGKEAL